MVGMVSFHAFDQVVHYIFIYRDDGILPKSYSTNVLDPAGRGPASFPDLEQHSVEQDKPDEKR